ncbi:MAG: hemin uptake protein HemP [Pseudomonadota bacterium]
MVLELVTESKTPEVEQHPCHAATDLTQEGKIAHIVHEGQKYTLRITKAGKLILTK